MVRWLTLIKQFRVVIVLHISWARNRWYWEFGDLIGMRSICLRSSLEGEGWRFVRWGITMWSDSGDDCKSDAILHERSIGCQKNLSENEVISISLFFPSGIMMGEITYHSIIWKVPRERNGAGISSWDLYRNLEKSMCESAVRWTSWTNSIGRMI